VREAGDRKGQSAIHPRWVTEKGKSFFTNQVERKSWVNEGEEKGPRGDFRLNSVGAYGETPSGKNESCALGSKKKKKHVKTQTPFTGRVRG